MYLLFKPQSSWLINPYYYTYFHPIEIIVQPDGQAGAQLVAACVLTQRTSKKHAILWFKSGIQNVYSHEI